MNWYKKALTQEDDNWIDVHGSDCISSVAYDEDLEILEVKFRSGGQISYGDVPRSLYVGLLRAESKGRFFNDNIKDKFQVV